MITTKLQGGTGNQMFQYAVGLEQARWLGVELQIDIERFKNDPMREYTLGLFPRVTEKIVDNSIPTVGEYGMPFNQSLVDTIKDGSVLNGYWQTEKYFQNVVDELVEKFQPKPLTVEHRKWLHIISESKNPTFLTIRRTDYVGNSFHGELPISYYIKALKAVEQFTGKPDVFVFTDDTDWCWKNLNLPYDFHIAGSYDRTVKGHIGREDADIYLMSKCKNAVMANSTFSWWGAWLGPDKTGGVIVAPKKWFGPTSNEDARDIIPNRWITL